MTSKEKKDIVLCEVVKPKLKRAGYRSKGLNFVSMRFNFGFDIIFLQGDYSEERLKN